VPVPRLSLFLSTSTTTATTRGKSDGKETVEDAKEKENAKDKEKEETGKEKGKYALTEAEKADKGDDLFLMNERKGGTLRVGVELGY